jgi:hypothetical protein
MTLHTFLHPLHRCSIIRKERLQIQIRLRTKLLHRALTRSHRSPHHRVRKPVPVHKHTDTRYTATVLHGLPAARSDRYIVGLNMPAIARLVVADQECDVL